MLPTKQPREVTTALIDDGRLRKLTFTGSTGVGKALVKQSADALLRTSMELGGNAPFVVFDDADVDAAVEGAMLAKMRNGGEACTAANRLHVSNALIDEFTDKFVKRMGRSPLATAWTGHQARPAGQRQAGGLGSGTGRRRGGEGRHGGARRSGARRSRLLLPGHRVDRRPAGRPHPQEEVFGPVAPIIGFDTEEEGIAAANDTEYGLASYIFTESLDRALRVAEALESGMVGVNRGSSPIPPPFGGVKESGFGREGGYEGIEEYLDTKYIALTK